MFNNISEETYIDFYQTTQRRVPEGTSHHSDRRHNLKSHKYIVTCDTVTKDGVGLLIGFINLQVVTIINHYTIAALHNL
jgi:hypothetical protein